jgi:tetratricopeptide (TPR) repeat protein
MPSFRRKNEEAYRAAARLLADGRHEEAIAVLRTYLSENPKHTNAMVTLAVALMEKQAEPKRESPETNEALELLDKAVSLAKKDAVPLFNRGLILRNLGMLEEALESFKAAARLDRKLPLALLHSAEISYELELWEQAIEFARAALVKDPGMESALTWVKTAMEKAGYIEDKRNVIVKDNPDDNA